MILNFVAIKAYENILTPNFSQITVCDQIYEKGPYPANINFELYAFLATKVSFQPKHDYCMNGSIGP